MTTKRKWNEHQTTFEMFQRVQQLGFLEIKLGDLQFQRVIQAQKRIEIGAHTLDMLDEYEKLLRP